jgi:hypothetical protein
MENGQSRRVSEAAVRLSGWISSSCDEELMLLEGESGGSEGWLEEEGVRCLRLQMVVMCTGQEEGGVK